MTFTKASAGAVLYLDISIPGRDMEETEEFIREHMDQPVPFEDEW